MKKYILGLIATLAIVSMSFGQSIEKETGVKYYKIDYNEFKSADGVDLPLEKEAVLSKGDIENLINVKVYLERIKGFAYISGKIVNGEAKFVSIKVPKTLLSSKNPNGCGKGYRSCARGCTTNSTELGVLFCTFYCMIDCSGN